MYHDDLKIFIAKSTMSTEYTRGQMHPTRVHKQHSNCTVCSF